MGLDPKIEKTSDSRVFVPEPFKSVLLISADFELAWAWQFTKSDKNPLQKALKEAKKERNNIPVLLNLFEKYKIPVTWLTVGHLFLESCKKNNDKCHENLPRLKKFESEYWNFNTDDWFINDPCSDYKTSPEWY